MKIGVALFRLRPERMAAVARHAEALGFESVWVPEHLVLPTRIASRYPYAPDGVPPFAPDAPHLDPLILLTHVAAATSRIRLGTNIYLLPLRHPLVTARLAMSLDVLSGGRLTLGVGVGWLAEEFQAAGIEFQTRASRTRECVRALRALWTEAEPEFHGRFFSFGPVKFEPKPVQKPHPPIVFGGETEAALRRAAALGDGWYGVGHTPESAAVQAGRLRALLAAAGRGNAMRLSRRRRGGCSNFLTRRGHLCTPLRQTGADDPKSNHADGWRQEDPGDEPARSATRCRADVREAPDLGDLSEGGAKHKPPERNANEAAAVADGIEERRHEDAQRHDGEECRTRARCDVGVDGGELLRTHEPLCERTSQCACETRARAGAE